MNAFAHNGILPHFSFFVNFCQKFLKKGLTNGKNARIILGMKGKDVLEVFLFDAFFFFADKATEQRRSDFRRILPLFFIFKRSVDYANSIGLFRKSRV